MSQPVKHLAVLASLNADLGHFRAAQTVLALLVLELASLFPKVTLVTCGCTNPSSPETIELLEQKGVAITELPFEFAEPAPPRNRFEVLRRYWQSIVRNRGDWDTPALRDPEGMARRIEALDADAALLFWDTHAEYVLPYMKTPAFGYLARPPKAASISRVMERTPSLRRTLELAALKAQHKRHLGRMRKLNRAANICAVDAADYRSGGVSCDYISNTWADACGAAWAKKRAAMEGALPAPQILANIGAVDATGNNYGIRYFAKELLPRLAQLGDSLAWSVSICGRGNLPDDLAKALDHPRVHIKGFVPDIDAELMSSAVVLLLNNMGPYTGGYTRVAYAFATGACLVASDKLKRSMVELVDEENCLLGRDADEILQKVVVALTNVDIRRRLGKGARSTYEEVYHPALVASRIKAMTSLDIE